MKNLDKSTSASKGISYGHHELHDGNAYEVFYSVSNIGDMTTPNDAIQLTWTTPGGPKEMHLINHAQCGSTALYKFTEGWSVIESAATGSIIGYNKNRLYPDSSIVFSYDAGLVLTGTVLETEYLSTGKFGSGETRASQEWVLRPNENYAVSLFLNGAATASLGLDFYMHAPKK